MPDNEVTRRRDRVCHSMRIMNMRLGFANNSSSSHSVLVGVGADGRVDYGDVGCNGSYAFGWEPGAAGTEETKRRYLASTVFSSIYRPGMERLALELARSVDPKFDASAKPWSVYVDHQSLLPVPRAWTGVGIDREFLDEMEALLLRPDVVVTLGNDNEDCDNGPAEDLARAYSGLPTDFVGDDVVVARREAPGVWTLFAQGRGHRITFAFEDSMSKPLPERLCAPWLVDVKITDYCPFRCDFCYQNSTTSGQHADFGAIETLAEQAGAARIFEVAIGGGEPTLHPRFVDVLRAFRARGVVPNFTTYSDAWIRDDAAREAVLAACGSFAYSAMTAERIEALADLLGEYDMKERAAVHIIMGLLPTEATLGLLATCRECGIEAVTLLGYKNTGRGAARAPYDYVADHWLRSLVSMRWDLKPYRVGIDTALAAQSRADIERCDIPEWLYHTTEGSSSMYVDLVEGAAAPSSYHEDHVVRHDSLAESWAAIESVEGDVFGRSRVA